MGIPAHIVMPTISTPSKIAATKGYGAKVIFSGSTSTEREAVVADVMKDTGARLIPPYDHPDIMLGQGTLGIELQEQAAKIIASGGSKSGKGLDAIIAPCGGGGMPAFPGLGGGGFSRASVLQSPTSVSASDAGGYSGGDCNGGNHDN